MVRRNHASLAHKPETIHATLSRRKLNLCKYLEQLARVWEEVVLECPLEIKRIVCLGLGSFQSSWRAQCQLLLLQQLVQSCKIAPNAVFCFDPQFTEDDRAYLAEQGYGLFEDDDYLAQESTLFYLPHAPRSLCEKVLAQNESYWDRHLFLANDLNSYDNVISKQIREEIPFILKALTQMQSKPLPDSEDAYEAFNDIAFRWIASKSA